MMEKDGSHMTERIFNLTLEIIYLLTGEEYTVVKKTSGEHFNLNNHLRGMSRKLKKNNKKIMEVTSNIIELLMREDWNHIEGHKDLYKDIKKENHPTYTSTDGFSDRNSPDGCPYSLHSRDSTQEDHTIPQHHQVEDLVGIKVEIVEGEDLYLTDEQPCLEEDSPTFITPDGHYSRMAEDVDTVQPSQGDNSGIPSSDQIITLTQARPTDKIYPCAECGKCFTHMSNRIRHMKIHKGLKPFPCLECGKCFTRKTHLTGHQRKHTAKKPFSSPEDVDTVQPAQGDNSGIPSSNRIITRTRARPTDKIYPCSECGKCFTHMSNRIRHMKIHKGLKPFACSECGKCFTRKSHLAGHQRIHTGEKPFPCPLCGKLFKHKSHLVIHNRTHTGEKPFICRDCGKCFGQQANLLGHQKVHTGGKT
ncbi:gastrula zinc finger protein XlCGF66.1-like isoform X1 [Aquarana catesbeiana]|uniref:gastrula zinc finger protein XlCGF66.1-like isoform X1 n=2 Tax=Aquarana catesbeiana TaxID=8400 RepID=UPI003CC96C13